MTNEKQVPLASIANTVATPRFLQRSTPETGLGRGQPEGGRHDENRQNPDAVVHGSVGLYHWARLSNPITLWMIVTGPPAADDRGEASSDQGPSPLNNAGPGPIIAEMATNGTVL